MLAALNLTIIDVELPFIPDFNRSKETEQTQNGVFGAEGQYRMLITLNYDNDSRNNILPSPSSCW